MKQHLLWTPVLAILALFIQSSATAQDSNQDRDDDAPRKYDEIVIRHKSGKDAKVTIEIKDGEVLVNGKPASEYEDSSMTIHKRRITGSNSYSLSSSDEFAPRYGISMFPNGSSGGGWSFSDDNMSSTKRAQLGVMSEKREGGKGVKITGITKASAAEKIGLKPGDVILKIDDNGVASPQSLSSIIGTYKPGDKVEVTFSRDGKEQKQSVVLGKAKAITIEPMNGFNYEMPEMPEIATLPPGSWSGDLHGFITNSMKFGIRAQDAEDGKGVKVLDVDEESTASKAGIKEGDVITHFDGKEISSVTALTAAARNAREKITVKVTIVRDGKAQEIDVRVPRRLKTADL
jgi:serine protease Do